MSVFYFHGIHNKTYFLNLAPSFFGWVLYAAGRVDSSQLRPARCLTATMEPQGAISSSSKSYGMMGVFGANDWCKRVQAGARWLQEPTGILNSEPTTWKIEMISSTHSTRDRVREVA